MATKIKNLLKSNLGLYSKVRTEKYALYLWIIYQDFKSNLSYKLWCYYMKYYPFGIFKQPFLATLFTVCGSLASKDF